MEEKSRRIAALRGAARCENTAESITEQAVSLFDELLARNSLCEDDLISLVFSVTADLDARNPCAALRSKGRASRVPLFAVQEAATLDSLPRTLRILLHCTLSSSPRHVYQNGAEALRPDLAETGKGNCCAQG